MTIRIVDYKKLDMTEDEWKIYQDICKSYTSIYNTGEDYFTDLFESDSNGIILFLKPPSKRQTSLEIYFFIMNLFCHQHMRLMTAQVAEMASEFNKKQEELNLLIKKTKKIKE